MAKKIFTGKIDKTVDWGGDKIAVNESTGIGSHSESGENFDSVSGERVQEFIKNQLEGKWGFIRKDEETGYYRAFADEESCNEYYTDPSGKAYLLLGEFEAYSNYRAELELVSHPSQVISVLSGSTNNIIRIRVATFSKSEEGSFNPEMVKATYTITRPDKTNTKITHNVPANAGGWAYDELTLDNYIVAGENNITVQTVGTNTNSVANMLIIFNVINLTVEDDINIGTLHGFQENEQPEALAVVWRLSGLKNSRKGVDVYLSKGDEIIVGGGWTTATTKDCELCDEYVYYTYSTTSNLDNIDITGDISLSSVAGAHAITYRAWLEVEGVKYYTPTYYKSVIVNNENEAPIVSISLSGETGTGLKNLYDTPVIYGLSQYSKYYLPMSIYKEGAASITARVSIIPEGQVDPDVSYVNDFTNGVVNNITLVPSIEGNAKIKIEIYDELSEEYVYLDEYDTVIEAIDWDISEHTTNLLFSFDANGRTNGTGQDVWTGGKGVNTFEGNFEGFTWDGSSGWKDDRLVINEGNVFEIIKTGESKAFNPLNNPAISGQGFTIEIEFQTINVANDNAVIWDMQSDAGAGLLLTASEATLSNNLGQKVSTKFKSKEDLRISFVASPDPTNVSLMYIYVNGAMCGAVEYNEQIAQFGANKGIRFEGTSNAGIRIKQLRVYNTKLTPKQIVDNYILYRDTAEEKKICYDRNNVYSEGGYNIEALKNMMPIMFFTNHEEYDTTLDASVHQNNLEFLMGLEKDQKIAGIDTKKVPVLIDEIEFINPGDPLTNFKLLNAHVTCQGTSSMAYPVKNLRVYTKNRNKNDDGAPIFDGGWPMPELDEEYNPAGKDVTLFYGKKGKGKDTISFKSGLNGTTSEGCKAQPVNCWCLKADYAESSSSHNTGVARIWNDAMKNATVDNVRVCETYAQRKAREVRTSKYPSGYTYDVRTTIDGYPMLLFYRTSKNSNVWRFVGKFNFNNDKSTESVFGFCDIPGVEYQVYTYFTEGSYETDSKAFIGGVNDPEYYAYGEKIPGMDIAVEYIGAPANRSNHIYNNTDQKIRAFFDNKDFPTYDDIMTLTNEQLAELLDTPYEYSPTYQHLEIRISGSDVFGGEFYTKKRKLDGGSIYVKNYCVEFLENGTPLASFTALPSDFEGNWEESWEFRFPEGTNDVETNGGKRNLQEMYNWIHSTMINPIVYAVLGEDGKYTTTYNQSIVTEETPGAVPCLSCPVADGGKQYVPREKFFEPGSPWNAPITIGGVDLVKSDNDYNYFGEKYHETATITPSDYEEYKALKHAKFEREKWDHLDIFKMAAYYSYLMRFGAVDQVVKNSMFTTEGGGSYVYNNTLTVNTVENPDGTTAETRTVEHNLVYTQTYPCKWFFINYDNDTILGLDNDGKLVYGPYIDRQTIVSGGYVYAGHDSVLWNNLEDDAEFMEIVSLVDRGLSQAKPGTSYSQVIKIFNDEQADKWCENIINDDAVNKYLNTADKRGQITKLQGPRSSHRRWWLSKRFAYFDSKFVSGDYESTNIDFKVEVSPAYTPSCDFFVTPIDDMNYGWKSGSFGQKAIHAEKNPETGRFEDIRFSVTGGGATSLAIGNPMYIYGVAYIEKIDLGCFGANLDGINFGSASNPVLGTTLKTVILGNGKNTKAPVTGATNTRADFKGLTGLYALESLEVLDVWGLMPLKSLDLSSNANIKRVYAFNSGIQSITLPNGTRIEYLEVPGGFSNLILNGANYFTLSGLVFEKQKDGRNDYSSLAHVSIRNSKEFETKKFFFDWYEDNKNKLSTEQSITIDGINWNITMDNLDAIEVVKRDLGDNLKLYGTIKINNNTVGTNRVDVINFINRVKEIFGPYCLDRTKHPDVYVTFDYSMVVVRESSNVQQITAGKASTTYVVDVYPEVTLGSTLAFGISGNTDSWKNYVVVRRSDTGEATDGAEYISYTINNLSTPYNIEITAKEAGFVNDITLNITAYFKNQGSSTQSVSETSLLIKKPVYPTSGVSRIDGLVSLYQGNEYTYTLVLGDITGSYHVAWSYTGTNVGGLTIEAPNDSLRCSVYVNEEPDILVATEDLNIKARVFPDSAIGGFTEFTIDKDLLILNNDVIMTIQSNPVMMAVARNAGWTDSEVSLLRDDISGVTADNLYAAIHNYPQWSSVTGYSFNEITEFTGVTTIKAYTFEGTPLESIKIPAHITSLGEGAFRNCQVLKGVDFDRSSTITRIPQKCFSLCKSLNTLELPNSVHTIEAEAFALSLDDSGRYGFKEIVVKKDRAEKTAGVGQLLVPDTLKQIRETAFANINMNGDTYYCGVNKCIERIELPYNLGLNTDVKDWVDKWLIFGNKVKEFVCQPTRKVDMDDPTLNPAFSNFIDSNGVSDGVLYSFDGNQLIKYPTKKVGDTYVLPESVSIINEKAFAFSLLTGITFNNQTIKLLDIYNTRVNDINKTVGNQTFYGSSRLVKIDMGEATIEKLGYETFTNCSALKEIVWPKGLVEIKNNSFEYCNSIEVLVLPDTLRFLHIGDNPERSNYQNFDGTNLSYNVRGLSFMQGLKRLYLSRNLDMAGQTIVNNFNSIEYIMLPLFSSAGVDDEGQPASIYNNKEEGSYGGSNSVGTIDGQSINYLVMGSNFVKMEKYRRMSTDATGPLSSIDEERITGTSESYVLEEDDEQLVKVYEKGLYFVGTRDEEKKYVLPLEKSVLIYAYQNVAADEFDFLPTVGRIWTRAMAYNASKKIEVPDTVENSVGIGSYVFASTTSQYISLPNTIDKLPSNLFENSQVKKLVFYSREFGKMENSSLMVPKANDITFYSEVVPEPAEGFRPWADEYTLTTTDGHLLVILSKTIESFANESFNSLKDLGKNVSGLKVLRVPYTMAPAEDPSEFVPSTGISNMYLSKLSGGTASNIIPMKVREIWGTLEQYQEDGTTKYRIPDYSTTYVAGLTKMYEYCNDAEEEGIYLPNSWNYWLKRYNWTFEWIVFGGEIKIAVNASRLSSGNAPYIKATPVYTYHDDNLATQTTSTANMVGTLGEDGYFHFTFVGIDGYSYEITDGPSGPTIANVKLMADKDTYEQEDIEYLMGSTRSLKLASPSQESTISVDDYYRLKNEIEYLKLLMSKK